MTAPADSPPSAEVTDGATRRTPPVIRLLVLATFVVILNETIMFNAIPRLMDSFQVSAHAAQWVSSAFMLTMAAVIPMTGWFLQRFSTRTAYATAMGTFITGTAIAGAAPVFEVLLLGRVVQAAGTAVMMPLLMTTLLTVVPLHDRGRVMGNVTLAISVAPALGPTVSGMVLQFGSWRLLFAVVLPIAAVIAWFGLRALENVGETKDGELDWISVPIAAAGFGGLVFGLSRFSEGESGQALGIASVGLVLVAAFVLRQLVLIRRSTPLLDLRALRESTFAKGLTLMSVAFMTMMGAMILLPLYLQDVRGISPLATGLLVMPGGLAMGLLGPTVGRLFDKHGGRPLVIPGSIGIVLALAGLTQISLTTPYVLVLALHVGLMLCLALMFTPVFTLSLGSLPAHLYSHGSSILGTVQQVAAAFGTALAVTVMSLRADRVVGEVGTNAANLSGMTWAFGVGGVLALSVVVMALLLPGRPADDPDASSDAAGEAAPDEIEAELEEIVDEECAALER